MAAGLARLMGPGSGVVVDAAALEAMTVETPRDLL